MTWRIRPGAISGETEVPGDKSVAHRALMLGALAEGRSTVRNLPSGADVRATASVLQQLGITLERPTPSTAVVEGGALRGAPEPVDCANSGTTMRLLAGILAGQPVSATLVGDRSLSRRPMSRIIEPLELMGASFEHHDGHAPLRIRGGHLRGIEYKLPVASAQVKSAILFAGLSAEGKTVVHEPLATRDHTERLMRATGVSVRRANDEIEIAEGQRPEPLCIDIPGDISSAAFLFAAAAMAGGRVRINAVGINPTRAVFLDVLEKMGATVTRKNLAESCNEPYADVSVAGPVRFPLTIGAADVPLLIDELPLVALLATQCNGTTVIRGASELRVKESDRVRSVAQLLTQVGASVHEMDDGLVVSGPTSLRGGGILDAGGDHRIAMLGAVAALSAGGETVVRGTEAVTVSFPAFAETLRSLGAKIDAD